MTRKIMLMLTFFSIGLCEEIGSVFVSYSLFPCDANYSPDLTNTSIPKPERYMFENGPGVSFGFILPVNLPIVKANYKVRAAYHEVTLDRYWSNNWYYVSASNVFLIGHDVSMFQNKLHLLPQIGLGLIYENIYPSWGSGYVYNLVFADYSIRIGSPKLTHVDLLINLEDGVAKSQCFHSPDKRLHFSLVLKI